MKIRLNAQVTNGVGKAGERKVYGPGECDVPDALAKHLIKKGVGAEVKKVAAVAEDASGPEASGAEATGDK